MQLNSKRKKQTQNKSTYNDFIAKLKGGKLNKLKLIIGASTSIVVLTVVTWGVAAYFGGADTKTTTDKDYTPSTTIQQSETEDDGKDQTQAQNTEEPEVDTDNSVPNSGTAPTSSATVPQPSSNNSSAATKPHDPNKCEPLNTKAAELRNVKDQKETAYLEAMASVKMYQSFYYEALAKYGNSPAMHEIVIAEADEQYVAQEARIASLQTEWNDALTKSNDAHKKYQECKAAL